jgi:hypothetical protein
MERRAAVIVNESGFRAAVRRDGRIVQLVRWVTDPVEGPSESWRIVTPGGDQTVSASMVRGCPGFRMGYVYLDDAGVCTDSERTKPRTQSPQT